MLAITEDFHAIWRCGVLMHFAENSFQGFDHRLLAVEVQRTHFVPRVAIQQVNATHQAILILAKAEDTAVMADVAKSKAPNSPVAGRATVFIFPDLNTGNTTYKAVQRSADLISIGPMLQGMRKPVNDLSRGALVDDIVYTIALTAIQSAQQQ